MDQSIQEKTAQIVDSNHLDEWKQQNGSRGQNSPDLTDLT